MKEKNKKTLKICLIIFLVVTLVLTGFLFFRKKKITKNVVNEDLKENNQPVKWQTQTNQEVSSFSGKVLEKNGQEMKIETPLFAEKFKMVKKTEIVEIKTWGEGPGFDRGKFEELRKRVKEEITPLLSNFDPSIEPKMDSGNNQGGPNQLRDRDKLQNKMEAFANDPVAKTVVEKIISWEEIKQDSEVSVVPDENDPSKKKIFLFNSNLSLTPDIPISQ